MNSAKNLYKSLKRKNPELIKNLNISAKKRLYDENNIDWISKALAHYIFRNGPIEDMHANNQLSQEDMKNLNKYMVNRIAGILKLVNDGDWSKIELMLATSKEMGFGSTWDPAEYDLDEIDIIFEHHLKSNVSKVTNSQP